ncbi:MAG: MotA/TolQ/ExbB proton channel family protein [Gemmatimonadota bacterium]|nr:MotA/TolQ/ExbB proton channel family protein [Gemmatimonadota bacterium]
MTLLQMFQDGGVFMWPLLACSILGFAVILVKFVTLRMAKVKTDRLIERVKELVREGRVEDAVELCANTRGPVAAILLTGLHLYQEGARGEEARGAEHALSAAGKIEMAFLEKGLVVLATIANVAPLLGFLGTVAGMILAFGAIAEAGEVEATLVAGGIKVALITTASGLAIAIPINIAHNWFVSQIDGLIIDMREGVQAIQDVMWMDIPREGIDRTTASEKAAGMPTESVQTEGEEGAFDEDEGTPKRTP